VCKNQAETSGFNPLIHHILFPPEKENPSLSPFHVAA
jgi:hypothetical protein